MEMRVRKERIRGVPRRGPLFTAAAALLMAAPVVQLILGKVLEDFYRSTTVLPCLLAVAGGILLLTARGKQAGYTVGGLLAILGSSVVISHMLLLPAMLLWGLSAIGVSWNKPVSRLLKGRSLPVLNLAAAILAAVSALLCLDTVGSMPAFALPLALAAVGTVLLCTAADAQTFLPLSPEQRAQQAPRVRYRSVLRPGMLGTLGAVLLLVCEVWQLIDLFRLMSAFHVSLGTLLQPALIFAAAVLLLLRAQNGPRLLPAAILLLIAQTLALFSMQQTVMYAEEMGAALQQTQRIALLFFSVLLLLIGVIGTTWNRPVGKGRPVPLCSAIAAALAAGNGIWAAVYRVSLIVEETRVDFDSAQGLIRSLLLPVGLVLVNLAMEGRQTEANVRKVDGSKYRQGLTGFAANFYSDVGGKLQLLAKICGVLYLIMGVLGVVAIALGIVILLLQLFGLIPPSISPMSLLMAGLIIIASALILAVGTWPLYAFGQITADLHAIRKDGVHASGAAEVPAVGSAATGTGPSADNPDELPEL